MPLGSDRVSPGPAGSLPHIELPLTREGKCGVMHKANEGVRSGVEPVESPSFRANPQSAIAVFFNGGDMVVAQAA